MIQIIKRGDQYAVREKRWFFWRYYAFDGWWFWSDEMDWGTLDEATNLYNCIVEKRAEQKAFKTSGFEVIKST